jgi:hypothetical protein
VFTTDSAYPRRFLLALAASIFVHAIIVAIGPLHPIETREQDRPSTPVVLERRTPPPPTPKPTARPTPKPRPTVAVTTPQPVVKRVVAAAPRATAKPAKHQGGSARPKELAKIVPTAAPPNGTATAAGNGVAAGGAGTGAGPGAGTGGANGTGAGGGGEQPCGHVSFVPTGAEQYVNGKFYETIRTIVEFPDGHTETAVFPYPWIYNNQNDDPWSPQNLRKPSLAARAQLPPPGTDVGDGDRLVKLVLQYTKSDGTTRLPLCPGQR